MRTKQYQDSLQDEILTANPVRLIQLLYRGALDSITSARRYLKLGDIRARSRAISKAMAIVTELSLSLDHAHGGELSKSLADLYAHAEILLIKANCEQSDLPLAEAERLLSTLSEAWQGVAPADQAAQPQTSQSTPYQPIRCAY